MRVAAFVVSIAIMGCKSEQTTVETKVTVEETSAPPIRTQVEDAIRKDLAGTPYSAVVCEDVGANQKSTTCTATAGDGQVVTYAVTPSGTTDEGIWTGWDRKSSALVVTGEELEGTVVPTLEAMLAKKAPNAKHALDCGASLVVIHAPAKHTCKLTVDAETMDLIITVNADHTTRWEIPE